jgi:hypothetical protein
MTHSVMQSSGIFINTFTVLPHQLFVSVLTVHPPQKTVVNPLVRVTSLTEIIVVRVRKREDL